MDPLFCYHIVLMILATLSFIFLWIGFATPGWLVVTFQETEARADDTVSSLNRSLFYDILCPQELKDCKTCRAGDDSKECVTDMAYPQYTGHYNWIEALSADTEEWVTWRIMMVITVLVCTVGFILVLCLVCCIFKTWMYRTMATTAFILWLIGGLLVWVPVGMVAHMYMEIDDPIDADHKLPLSSSHDATLHIPYSIILCAIGAFLALIVALMLLWLTGVCGKNKAMSRSRSNSELFSEPKMRPATVLTPQPHYYGPQPYYRPDAQVYYHEEPQRLRTVPVPTEEIVVDDYPYYKGAASNWGPNPWYDNRAVI